MTHAGFSEKNKPTVTFKPQNVNRLSDAENMIAIHYLRDDLMYLSKYIDVNYVSVNKKLDSLHSNLNYWNKIKLAFSHKHQYRSYADATGTDHLLVLGVKTTYDTVFTPEESSRLWDHLWEGSSDPIKELVGAKEAHYMKETYFINHIKYKLRYIDGHSGKTLWKMKCRWPSFLFGSKKKNPILLIKKKFEKKFPFKLKQLN
jgi:hypothetical protein